MIDRTVTEGRIGISGCAPQNAGLEFRFLKPSVLVQIECFVTVAKMLKKKSTGDREPPRCLPEGKEVSVYKITDTPADSAAPWLG